MHYDINGYTWTAVKGVKTKENVAFLLSGVKQNMYTKSETVDVDIKVLFSKIECSNEPNFIFLFLIFMVVDF